MKLQGFSNVLLENSYLKKFYNVQIYTLLYPLFLFGTKVKKLFQCLQCIPINWGIFYTAFSFKTT